jgi:hypothetical protein
VERVEPAAQPAAGGPVIAPNRPGGGGATRGGPPPVGPCEPWDEGPGAN